MTPCSARYRVTIVAGIPSSEKSNCTGRIFSIEMHHKSVEQALPGDNIGMNIKGLMKEGMPKVGDIIVLKSDGTLGNVKRFTMTAQILEHPGELKLGYSPNAFVRTAHAPCKLTAIKWRMGKDTGGQKITNPDPPVLKANDVAEIVMEPTMAFAVDKFANCEGLGRVALMDGNRVIMLGRVTDIEQ